MRGQQGFTLIELLIVVVIIGILALFAVPQFQKRTAASQVTRVVTETSQLRTAVDLCLMQGVTEAAKCDLGASKSDLITGDKPTLDINKASGGAKNQATITANFGGNAASVLHGKRVVWELSKTEGWVCSSNVDEQYATKGCGGSKAAAATPASASATQAN